MAGEVRLYQIYFKEDQLGNLFDFATPYFNEGLTVFFENSVIAKVIPHETSEKVGVCSWQLRQKSRERSPNEATIHKRSPRKRL